MKIKKDKYLRERGGNAKFIEVLCASCGKLILVYQKDGPGWLKRCYLNRIIEPAQYDLKSKDPTINEKNLGNLTCSCGKIIGSPMRHKDNRLAFHLIRGNFIRKIHKE